MRDEFHPPKGNIFIGHFCLAKKRVKLFFLLLIFENVEYFQIINILKSYIFPQI
jgi:hypothetical protein